MIIVSKRDRTLTISDNFAIFEPRVSLALLVFPRIFPLLLLECAPMSRQLPCNVIRILAGPFLFSVLRRVRFLILGWSVGLKKRNKNPRKKRRPGTGNNKT